MYKRFIFMLTMAVSLGFLLVGSFNVLVDPYGVWGLCRIVGFNMLSPQAEVVERLVKPVEFLRLDPMPDTVFLGTSQVMYAFDMDTYKRLTGHEAYNFGVRGASLYEQRRFLEHVLATDKNIQHLILGLSFSNFIRGKDIKQNFRPQSFVDISEQLEKNHITGDNLAKIVFSYAAIRESWIKIQANMENMWTHPYYMKSGKPYDDNLLDFFQRDHWRFDRTLILLERDGLYEGAEIDEDAWHEFERIVSICRNNEIELTLFIPPVHAMQMEEVAACWDTYEEWRRRIVQVEKVLDCTGYNDITTTDPKQGLVNEDTHPYFWDVMHCKTVVGDMIISQLVDNTDAQIGVWLTSDNLEQHLRELRAGRSIWEAGHQDILEQIRYYRGFSPLVPQQLKKGNFTSGESVIRLHMARQSVAPDAQANNGAVMARLEKDMPFHFNLKQSDYIDVIGSCFSSQTPECMYALLEGVSGSSYYALAEPVRSKETGDYMRSSRYDESGFRIYVSLRDLPVGEYGLRLVEVRQGGEVVESEVMGILNLVQE